MIIPRTENAPKLIHHTGTESNEWEMPKNDPLSLQLENHNITVQPEQPGKEISEAYIEGWMWKAISGPGAVSVGH